MAIALISATIAALVVALLLAAAALFRRTMQRLSGLERAIAEHRAQVEEVDARYRAVPGVVPGEKDWHVMVNGKRVAIRPLTGAQWLEAIQQLPEFVYAYAQERTKGKALAGQELERIRELARAWLKACGEGECELERITLPEAEHAVTHIAQLNGITENLRQFFRERFRAVAGSAPSSANVRGAAQPTDRPAPN